MRTKLEAKQQELDSKDKELTAFSKRDDVQSRQMLKDVEQIKELSKKVGDALAAKAGLMKILKGHVALATKQ